MPGVQTKSLVSILSPERNMLSTATTKRRSLAGGRLSADLGTELGEWGSAAIAIAPAPHGASAHSNHEPTASGGAERRIALREEVVPGRRAAATGIVPVSPRGEPPILLALRPRTLQVSPITLRNRRIRRCIPVDALGEETIHGYGIIAKVK